MNLERAIMAFETSVIDLAFIGAIPAYSDDPEEQQAIDRERRRIKINYTRAKNRLLRMMGGCDGPV